MRVNILKTIHDTTYMDESYIPFNVYPKDYKPSGSINIEVIPNLEDLMAWLSSGEFIGLDDATPVDSAKPSGI